MSFVTLNYTKGWRVGESSGPALDPPEFEDAVKRTVRDLCFYPPRIQIPTEASAIQSALNHFFMWSHMIPGKFISGKCNVVYNLSVATITFYFKASYHSAVRQ